MSCKQCGSEILDGAGYCSKCGTAISNSGEPQPATEVVAPSYGYQIDETTDRITITVPERSVGKSAGATVAAGCGFAMGLPVLLLLGAGIGAAFGGGLGAGIGCLIMAGPAYLLVKHDMGSVDDKIKNPHMYSEVIIGIERPTIVINNTAYDRAHIATWMYRWTESSGGGSFVAGSASAAIGVAIASGMKNELEKRKAEHSYRITFDYGENQILVVGGLTETGATRIMEAIQSSLSRMS